MSNYSKLIAFTDEIISCYSKKDEYRESYVELKDLTEKDIQEFSMHLFEYDDRDLSFILENNDYQSISDYIVGLLKKGSNDSKLDLSECIQEKIVEYYSPKMKELIQERISNLFADEMRFNGFFPTQDPINGEVTWDNRYGV